MGALAKLLYDLDDFSQFILGPEEEQDLIQRTEITCQLLGLSEPAQVLAERFLGHGFISKYFQDREQRHRKKE